jgi:CdiI immunity protein
MKSQDYPALMQFFGGYFHQDWVDEFYTPDDAIAAFQVGASPESLCSIREELNRLLLVQHNLEDQQSILRKVGCYYDPTTDGIPIIDWLEEVRVKLGNK